MIVRHKEGVKFNGGVLPYLWGAMPLNREGFLSSYRVSIYHGEYYGRRENWYQNDNTGKTFLFRTDSI